MLIAEELILVALDPVKGTVPLGAKTYLNAGLAAARARSAVLLALAGPCRLLERVAPDRSGRRRAKTRIKEATEKAPFGPEVKQVIDELIAAVAVAAVVASSAGGNG